MNIECEEKEELTYDDTQIYSSMTGLPDQRRSDGAASNNVFYPSQMEENSPRLRNGFEAADGEAYRSAQNPQLGKNGKAKGDYYSRHNDFSMRRGQGARP